jgi:uncharacterized membrane protein
MNKKSVLKKIIIIILTVLLVKVYGECRINSNKDSNFTPIPTAVSIRKPTFPLPPHPYYDNITSKIKEQNTKWQEELGWAKGRQKTVDWLNRKVPDYPLPPDIADAIEKAELDEPYTIRYTFKNGHVGNIIQWTSAPGNYVPGYIITFLIIIFILISLILFLINCINIFKRGKNRENGTGESTSISEQEKF